MYIDYEKQQIHLKIVYYGPAVSGKTSNLLYIHSKVPSAMKGELVSLQTPQERTIFFDFLQLETEKIQGKTPKLNLYTAPGLESYLYNRTISMAGVDGVVFVADSQAENLDMNKKTLRDLRGHLSYEGRNPQNFPWVIQYNKRDLPNVAPVPALEHQLNLAHVPHFEAVATQGTGVLHTLQGIISLVLTDIRKTL